MVLQAALAWKAWFLRTVCVALEYSWWVRRSHLQLCVAHQSHLWRNHSPIPLLKKSSHRQIALLGKSSHSPIVLLRKLSHSPIALLGKLSHSQIPLLRKCRLWKNPINAGFRLTFQSKTWLPGKAKNRFMQSLFLLASAQPQLSLAFLQLNTSYRRQGWKGMTMTFPMFLTPCIMTYHDLKALMRFTAHTGIVGLGRQLVTVALM